MVKKLSVIFILLSLSSCCYRGMRNSFGSPRKIMNVKKLVNNDIYTKIDTTSLYELKYYITNKGGLIPENMDFGSTFLKFFKNGKVGEFGFGYDHKNYKPIPNYKCRRDDFNPKKFRMGYFYIDGNEIKMRKFGIKFCKRNLFVSKIEILGDTIIERIRTDALLGEYDEGRLYIKKSIDRKLIDGWYPDW